MRIPYKRQKVNSGDLNKLVTFYQQVPNEDGEPGDLPVEQVYESWAQVYGASSKDQAYLSTKGKSEAVTIKIRNPGAEFVPEADQQQVYIDDYRYQNKIWDIKNVRPDFESDDFVIVVLQYAKAGDYGG